MIWLCWMCRVLNDVRQGIPPTMPNGDPVPTSSPSADRRSRRDLNRFNPPPPPRHATRSSRSVSVHRHASSSATRVSATAKRTSLLIQPGGQAVVTEETFVDLPPTLVESPRRMRPGGARRRRPPPPMQRQGSSFDDQEGASSGRRRSSSSAPTCRRSVQFAELEHLYKY